MKRLTLEKYIKLALVTESKDYAGMRRRLVASLPGLASRLEKVAASKEDIEPFKKTAFYGKNYIEPTSLPNPPANDLERALLRLAETDDGVRLLHGVFGVLGEATEIAEAVIAYAKGECEKTKIADELGDLSWSSGLVISSLDVPPSGVLWGNLKKLKKRHGEGFNHKSLYDRDWTGELAAVGRHTSSLVKNLSARLRKLLKGSRSA